MRWRRFGQQPLCEPPQLPAATIVNPKRDPHSTDEPAACGIAYYVLMALHQALDRQADEASMLELVALGTVCDMAPLVGDNRRLVQQGLLALAQTERPGLRALLAEQVISPSDRVVCILTGHSLKDPNATVDYHDPRQDDARQRALANPPVDAPADLDAIIAMLQR